MISNNIKIMRCLKQTFNNLQNKNIDTLYFVYDNENHINELYLGTELIFNQNLNMINTVINNIKNNDVLFYDDKTNKWINKNIKDVLEVFIAPTNQSNGMVGLVPAPQAGDCVSFLRSDGKWVNIPTFENDYITKNEAKELISSSIEEMFLEASW